MILFVIRSLSLKIKTGLFLISIKLIDFKYKPVSIFRERLRIINKIIAHIAFILIYIIPKPILRKIGDLQRVFKRIRR
jgi:hypothetical protein